MLAPVYYGKPIGLGELYALVDEITDLSDLTIL